MHLTNIFRSRAFAALSLASLFALPTLTALGCGQDVASCGTVCASDSNGDCQNSCSSMETNCSAANAAGDFQALLTCIGNANGTYDDVPELCQPEQATVSSSCGDEIER